MARNPSEGKQAEYKHLKLRLSNILHNSAPFCGVCLATDELLCGVDDLINIRHWEGDFTSTLRQIVVTLFDDMLLKSGNVCTDCKTDAVKAFIFIHNTRQSAQILENYIRQINKQINNINCVTESVFSDNEHAFMVLEDPTLIAVTNTVTLEPESDSDDDRTEIVHETKTDISNKFIACNDCDEEECIHQKYLVAYVNQKASGQTKIHCPDCNFQCWVKSLFIGHVNKVHLKTPSVICEHCSKPLYSRSAYKTHIAHFHSEMLVCEYCNSMFKYEHNLVKHKETCCNEAKPFLCDECCGTFTSERKLEYHKQKYHTGELKFPCTLCHKVFAKASLLDVHKRVHFASKTKPRQNYECGICHLKFPTLKERNEHKSRHDVNDRINCEICGIEFETQSEFTIHMATKHYPRENVKSYKCTLCEYVTSGRVFLEAHVNRYHLKISPYPCTQCPKKFTSTVKLNTHLKTHNPVKNHRCNQCGNLFCGPVALRKHIRLHTGAKPYGCSHCDKKFICASSRNAHIDRKHKPKSIECPICESLFHTLSMLRSHVKRVHWKREDKFDVTKVEGLTEEHYDLFKDRRFEMFS